MEKAPLAPLPAEKLYLFLPDKREAKIKAGHVSLTIDGVLYRFAVEASTWMGSDYRVVICFDRTDAGAGAVILNNETGSSNVKNLRPWGYIGEAVRAELAPQFAPTGYADSNVTRKKRQNLAFRTAFVAPGLFGRKGSSSRELRDGKGMVVKDSRGKAFEGFEGTRKDDKASEGDRLIAQSLELKKAQDAAAKVEKTKRGELMERAKEKAARHIAEAEWLKEGCGFGGFGDDAMHYRREACRESGELFGLPKKFQRGHFKLEALIHHCFVELQEEDKARRFTEEVAADRGRVIAEEEAQLV